jgi:chromosome segregation ATPase
MTFFIPPVFLFGNNANRLHNNEEEKSEYKTAAETEIKVENWRVKRIAELEEENKKLKSDLAFERTMLDNVRAEYKSLQNVNRKLNEKVRFLEECLDRKEKLNEKYRKEIDKLKSTYVYDAKQVRDIC